jgi:WD40 repeat protein
LKVWNLNAGVIYRTIEPKSGVVRGVAVSKDGRFAVSGHERGSLKVWDLQTGDSIGSPPNQQDVRAITLSVDGKRAYSTSYQIIKIWEVETGCELQTLNDHSHIVSGIALTPDERHAVSSSWQNNLMLWNLETGEMSRLLTGHSGSVNGVALSRDGKWIVSAADDKTIKVWDAETGAAVAEFTCEAKAKCCAFAGSRTIIAGDESGRVHFLALEPPIAA